MCPAVLCIEKRRPVSDIGGHLPLKFSSIKNGFLFYYLAISSLLFICQFSPSIQTNHNITWGTFKLCTHAFPLVRRD